MSYDGMTDPLGQSQVLPYLIGLSQAGFEISLLSCEKPAALKKNREVVSKLCVNAGINWHPIGYTKSPPVVATMKDVYALRRAAFKLHQLNPFDIVHCRSYISSLVGRSMRQRLGPKFIFDMRGFWADERIDGDLWNLNDPVHRLVYNFFKKREKTFLEQSDAIISLTEAAKTEMLTWSFDIAPEKIHVIPCCADFEHFNFDNVDSSCQAKLRSQLEIAEDALVLTYHGSTGTWYLVDEMLEFFKQVADQYPTAHLLFVTNDNLADVKEQAAAAGLPICRVTITTATRDQIPALLSLTDVSYFFIKPAYSKMSSCPTKLAEILGMGKPVICNSGVGDIEEIFATGEFGCVIDVEDRSAWHLAINALDRLVDLDPAEIRQRGRQLFSLQKGIEDYRKIYQDLYQRQEHSPSQLVNG